MKRLVFIFIGLVALLGTKAQIVTTFDADANGIQWIGERWNPSDNNVTITGCATSAADLRGKVVIPATVASGGKTYNVTQLKELSGNGFPQPGGYSTPWDDTTPHDGLFGYSNVTEIELSEGLEQIVGPFFGRMSRIKEIRIPASVKVLWATNFYHCDSLRRVIVSPNSQLYLDGDVGPFAFNSQLEYVDLGDANLTFIDTGMMSYADAHTLFYFRNECYLDEIDRGAFGTRPRDVNVVNSTTKTCKNFIVYDGNDYFIPHAFTAEKASYDRVFSGTSSKTLYLPYPTDLPTGMVAYKLVNKDGASPQAPGYDHSFVFRALPSGTRLEAYHPYLVCVTDGAPHTLPEMHNVEIGVTPDIQTTGQPATSSPSTWIFMGTTEKIENRTASNLNAYNIKDNVWYKIDKSVSSGHVAPFRAFVRGINGASLAKYFALVLEDDENTPTAIENISETENAIKSGKYPIYTIDGKNAGNDYSILKSGEIYIVNGKKFYKS